MRLLVLIVLLVWSAAAAAQQSEANEVDLLDELCPAMLLGGVKWNEQTSSRALTRYDCFNGEFAIEVDFNNMWQAAVGQALHYGNEMSRVKRYHVRSGIYLICKTADESPENWDSETKCGRHRMLLEGLIRDLGLPICTWFYLRSEIDDGNYQGAPGISQC